jgi:hypothetical protein
VEKRVKRFEKSGGLAKGTDLLAEEAMRLVKEVCKEPYFQCEFGLYISRWMGYPWAVRFLA